MKIVLSALLILFGFSISAQSDKVPALTQEVEKANSDTSKVKALLKLSAAYKTFDSAILYADRALALAQGSSSLSGEAASYKRMGDIFFDASNYPKALDNFLRTLRIYEKLEDKFVIAGLLNSIANVYARQDDYQTALEYYQASASA